MLVYQLRLVSMTLDLLWGVDISQRTVDMVKKEKIQPVTPMLMIYPAPRAENWHITTSTAELFLIAMLF